MQANGRGMASYLADHQKSKPTLSSTVFHRNILHILKGQNNSPRSNRNKKKNILRGERHIKQKKEVGGNPEEDQGTKGEGNS